MKEKATLKLNCSNGFEVGEGVRIPMDVRQPWYKRILGIKPKQELQTFVVTEVYGSTVEIYPAVMDGDS